MVNINYKDFFEKGIVSDLTAARSHYFIWRTIGENHYALEELGQPNPKYLFGALQAGSHSLAVLSMARIFDAVSNRHPNRSIYSLLSNDFESNGYYPMDFEEFESLAGLRNFVQSFYTVPAKINEYCQLKSEILEILNQAEVRSKIVNVKFIRDKFLAHNEHEVDYSHLENFWTEFEFLINLLSNMVYLLGLTITGVHYSKFRSGIRQDIDFAILLDHQWLFDELEQCIGNERFNYWWKGV